MDHERLDELARALSGSPPRRAVARALVALLLGGAVAGAALDDAAAKKRRKRRRKRPPPRQPDAACRTDTPFSDNLFGREAQTFVEPNGGRLTAARLRLAWAAGTTGDYLLQVNTVEQGTGTPTDNTIASVVVPSAGYPAGEPAIVGFVFPEPPVLVAGRRYALVVSRPPSGSNPGRLSVYFQDGDPCPGGGAFEARPTGPFFEAVGRDLYFETYVDP